MDDLTTISFPKPAGLQQNNKLVLFVSKSRPYWISKVRIKKEKSKKKTCCYCTLILLLLLVVKAKVLIKRQGKKPNFLKNASCHLLSPLLQVLLPLQCVPFENCKCMIATYQ